MKGPKQSLFAPSSVGLFLLVLLASSSLQQLACADDLPNLSCTRDGENTNDCVRYLARGTPVACCDLQPVDFNCLCYDPHFPDIPYPRALVYMGYFCGFSLPESCMDVWNPPKKYLIMEEVIKKGGRDLKPSGGAGGFQ